MWYSNNSCWESFTHLNQSTLVKQGHRNLYLDPVTPSRCRRIVSHPKVRVYPGCSEWLDRHSQFSTSYPDSSHYPVYHHDTATILDLYHGPYLALAQFPEGGGPRSRPPRTTAFIRLAQVVVGTIWLDLRALNQGYPYLVYFRKTLSAYQYRC